MPKYEIDDDPQVSFPIWLLGSPPSIPPSPLDLMNDLVHVTAEDGEEAVLIFTEESAARKFLETHGGDEWKDSVPRVVSDPKDLDLLLHFLFDKMGVKRVFIGKPGDKLSISSIVKFRFNVAMQHNLPQSPKQWDR
jgi:hypothetical protein